MSRSKLWLIKQALLEELKAKTGSYENNTGFDIDLETQKLSMMLWHGSVKVSKAIDDKECINFVMHHFGDWNELTNPGS